MISRYVTPELRRLIDEALPGRDNRTARTELRKRAEVILQWEADRTLFYVGATDAERATKEDVQAVLREMLGKVRP